MILENIFVFILGAIVGSFLNVAICRLDTGEDMVFKKSHCPKCQKNLAWFDMFPILSFAALKGKCRHCGEKISWQYPLVELAAALMFVLVYYFYGSSLLNLVFLWLICSLCIAIFVFDLKHYLIPEALIFSGLAVIFIYRAFNVWALSKVLGWSAAFYSEFLIYLFSGIGFALVFFVPYFLSQEKWMGFGDVELAFFLGAFLGPEKSFLALLLSTGLGAIIGLILVGFKKKGLKSQIPFGPFLVAGGLAAFFFGEAIWNYYFSLI